MEKDCRERLKVALSLKCSIENSEEIANEIIGEIKKNKNKIKEFNDFYEMDHQLTEKSIDKFVEDLKNKTNNDQLHQAILFSAFDISSLQPANYDLHLGKECYVTTEKYPKILETSDGAISIEPGEFGILTTHEYIYVPSDLLGLISLKFTYKKQGLVNISGFHVDPGYHGRIIFAVYNTGPKSILLRYKDPVFMIMYDTLEKRTAIEYKGSTFTNIPVDIISNLKGPSVSVMNLNERIKSLETHVQLLYGLLAGIFIAILAKVFG